MIDRPQQQTMEITYSSHHHDHPQIVPSIPRPTSVGVPQHNHGHQCFRMYGYGSRLQDPTIQIQIPALVDVHSPRIW